MSKRISKDMVFDSQGKRRFHGAFTGGFIKEANDYIEDQDSFVPTSYVSTRDNRHSYVAHNKDEYMDEEDKANYYKNIKMNHRFTDQYVNRNFGVKADTTTNNFRDVDKSRKINRYGVGYKPAMNHFSYSTLSNENEGGSRILRMSDILHGSTTNSASFGIGALEDDDDENIYANDTIEQFKASMEIPSGLNQIEDQPDSDSSNGRNRHHRHHRSHHHHSSSLQLLEDGSNHSRGASGRDRQTSDGYRPVDGFVFPKYKSRKIPNYSIERAPSSFRMGHIFKEALVKFWKTKIQVQSIFDSKESKKEESPPSEKNAAIEDLKSKLHLSFKSKFVKSGTLQADGKIISTNIKPPTIEKPKEIKLIRTKMTFRPAKLLCKRMNIIDPYEGILPDYVMSNSSGPSSLLDSSLSTIVKMGQNTRPNTEINQETRAFYSAPPPVVVDPLEDLNQPDVDLFSTVFGDS